MHLRDPPRLSSMAEETVIKAEEYCQSSARIALSCYSASQSPHHSSQHPLLPLPPAPFYIFFAVRPQRRTSADYHLVAVLVNIYQMPRCWKPARIERIAPCRELSCSAPRLFNESDYGDGNK